MQNAAGSDRKFESGDLSTLAFLECGGAPPLWKPVPEKRRSSLSITHIFDDVFSAMSS